MFCRLPLRMRVGDSLSAPGRLWNYRSPQNRKFSLELSQLVERGEGGNHKKTFEKMSRKEREEARASIQNLPKCSRRVFHEQDSGVTFSTVKFFCTRTSQEITQAEQAGPGPTDFKVGVGGDVST
eukprot:768478-Hanusia_phi.AAC.7